jgi:hypothetical protein
MPATSSFHHHSVNHLSHLHVLLPCPHVCLHPAAPTTMCPSSSCSMPPTQAHPAACPAHHPGNHLPHITYMLPTPTLRHASTRPPYPPPLAPPHGLMAALALSSTSFLILG